MNTRKIIAVWAAFALSVFAAQAQQIGPGGVDKNLKLWLRADDASKLSLRQETVYNYTSNPQTTIAWINVLPSGQNPSSTQTVVNEWHSSVGSTVYNNVGSDPNGRRRKPVFIEHHYLMNYHPTVDFYAHWIGNGAYTSPRFTTLLSTSNPPMSAKPANSSTFAVLNAAVKTGRYNSSSTSDEFNVYFMSWHDTPYTTTYTSMRPALGMKNNGGEGQPRLRLEGHVDITTPAFTPGATTIAEYRLLNVPNSGNITSGNITVGYNMKYVHTTRDESTTPWHMNGYGSLGGHSLYYGTSGNNHSRSFKGMISEVVQFEGTLTEEEQNKINSYFAIKYGITLKHTTGRYDYTLSDHTPEYPNYLWQGATGGGIWATYYNNLAAVVNDENSNWHNRQAHSTDMGSLVHLGVPSETGTPQLYFDGTSTGLGELQDGEAVMIGNDEDSKAGIVPSKREECGSFEYIFKRKWLVNKQTNFGRPVTLLVGAQNNSLNNLGLSAPDNVKDMYSALVSGNDVVMIVADSPDKLDPTKPATYGQFTAVVPMQYLNGEFQCMYTFKEDETYITFGYRQNTSGCPGEVIFSGSKTLNWNQWTRANANRTFASNPAASKTLTASLGDGISAKTTVAYGLNVRADRYYPNVTASPRGALDLMRRTYSGAVNTPVTTTIEFTKGDGSATPLMPEFFISGLDSRSRQYDKITVTGYCGGLVVMPQMTYAGNPSSASYSITNGNIATVTKNNQQSATATAGRVNVAFRAGVDRVVVEYALVNRGTSTAQHIYISPLTIKPVPPPVVINEDGLAFVEDVSRSEITTCEEEEYIFYIENINTVPKYVNFSDVLPPGLKWHTLMLDDTNSDRTKNPFINVHPHAGTNTLTIDSLLIPCVSTVRISATAKIDSDAVVQADVQRIFLNHSTITYNRIVNSQPEPHSLLSMDKFTHDPETPFTAIWAQKKDSVIVTHTQSYTSYLPNREIEVTLTVKNKNAADVSNVFLNLDWDAGFTYVNNSFSGRSPLNSPVGVIVTPDEAGDPSMDIAGVESGENGFRLSSGETVFKFKLRAPANADLQPEYNEQGVVVSGKYATLHLDYEFTIEQDDPCLIESLINAAGEIRMPYNSGRTHLVTNKHVTGKIKK